MKPLMTAAVLALISGQASALSCLRPDPIETFQRLAAAPDTYFVLHGVLSFDENALPEGTSFDDVVEPDPIPGRFVGKGLTADGFTNTYVSNVQLQVTCAGPWCGTARSGVEAVYFVPASDPPVSLIAGPCGGMIFEDPSQAVLSMLTSCMQGGNCSPIPFDE
jgi:hypothetical protein